MKYVSAVVIGLVAFSGMAQAEDISFRGRIGPSVGIYTQDSALAIRLFDANGNEVEPEEPNQSFKGDDENSYGLQTGLSAAYANFFVDLAVEYQMVDADSNNLDRTDLLLSAGSLVGDHLQFFAGYRRGMQGDGVFDDETFSESGLFIGAGVSGMSMGPLVLGTSVAYNLSEASDFPQPGTGFLYKGVSVKLSASLASLPGHSLQLRYQRFNGDGPANILGPLDLNDDGTPDGFLQIDRVELTETYIQLTYLYSFDL